MDWVIDASFALAWGLPDESSPAAGAFLAGLADQDKLWVPALWFFEVANAITTAKRRGRITSAQAAQAVEKLGSMIVYVDPLFGREAIHRHHSLALDHQISSYDAAYLDLAQRCSAGLATSDIKLAAAAKEQGVTLWNKL